MMISHLIYDLEPCVFSTGDHMMKYNDLIGSPDKRHTSVCIIVWNS